MQTHRASLGPDERIRLKADAVRGRPYAERVSCSFALHLLALREGRGDYFAVLDELDFLEGIRKVSRTKGSTPFTDPRLRGIWHKHYSSARHIPRNISNRWHLKALEKLLAAFTRERGGDADMWPRGLAHRLTSEGYEARIGHLTGEWILYAVHEKKNYYLTLATHAEGRDAQVLQSRLRRQCEAEWPFLFDQPPG